MKNAFKKFLMAMLVCMCALSLVSCGSGIKGDDAKALINDFFEAIVAEDYDKADSLLHPDCTADLRAFLHEAEKEKGLDFQAGIEIEKYTGFNSTVYSSNVGGSIYELSMRTIVGGKEAGFTFKIVKNETGYGIISFTLTA